MQILYFCSLCLGILTELIMLFSKLRRVHRISKCDYYLRLAVRPSTWNNSAIAGHTSISWIKRDQLDVTCFIISLFNTQRVSDVNTSILRSLRLICWVISWVVLLWFDVCWCYTSNQSNTTHEITQQISCKLLRMDVLTSETVEH